MINENRLFKELSDIKALLILQANKSGIKQDEIGKCIGIGQSRVAQILAGTDNKSKGEYDGKGKK